MAEVRLGGVPVPIRAAGVIVNVSLRSCIDAVYM